MKEYFISDDDLTRFGRFLKEEEREDVTIEKYLREIRAFHTWLGKRFVTKEAVLEWKEHLQKEGYASVTINAKLSALNGFFRFMGWETCRVKFLRIQQQIFRKQSKELIRTEYERLLETARKEGKERLALLMETICSTGIRVSELTYVTVEAAREGRAEVELKGKIRVILLPGKLCRKLLKYAKKQGNISGKYLLPKVGEVCPEDRSGGK